MWGGARGTQRAALATLPALRTHAACLRPVSAPYLLRTYVTVCIHAPLLLHTAPTVHSGDCAELCTEQRLLEDAGEVRAGEEEEEPSSPAITSYTPSITGVRIAGVSCELIESIYRNG